MARCTKRNMRRWIDDRSPLLGFFLTVITPRRSPATISSFDYGYKVPTGEGGGGRCPGVERGHRSLETRKEGLEYLTSHGYL